MWGGGSRGNMCGRSVGHCEKEWEEVGRRCMEGYRERKEPSPWRVG